MKKGLTVLLLALAASAQPFYSTQPPRGTCNPGLLATYGLEVIRKPTNDTNFICPAVEDNCCTTTSQLYIFKKWMGRGERARLLQVYKTIIATYEILFDDFKLVEKMAGIVLAQIPSDQITNCGEMAKTIRTLKASTYKQTTVKALERAFRFVYDSRRGFYCSLCDADAHANYNTLDGNIRMSYGFCANLVKETIGWSGFRYEHFPKIARLYGYFMSTCQSNGKYNPTNTLKESHKFFQNKRFMDQMKNCVDGLNHPAAGSICYDYCAHFNPAKFSRLFEGQFEKLLGFRIWLNKEVVAKILSSLHGKTKDDLSLNGRLLAVHPRWLQQNQTPGPGGPAGGANSPGTGAPAGGVGGSGAPGGNPGATPGSPGAPSSPGAPGSSGAPGGPDALGAPGSPGSNPAPAGPTVDPFPEDMSPVNYFNKLYHTQALQPVTYSPSEDFRVTRVFNYHSSIFALSKDRFYNLADFRVMLHSSGINFQTYGYMFKIDKDTRSALEAQLQIEADADYRNVTDIFSPNYGYRNSSVQIIG